MIVPAAMKDLLAAAQEGDVDKFRNSLEKFLSENDAAEFGKVAHQKSGDAILHILARNGYTSCLRFLLEEFKGKTFVDIEIR